MVVTWGDYHAINSLFDDNFPKVAQSLRGQMNNHFQTIKPVPSS